MKKLIVIILLLISGSVFAQSDTTEIVNEIANIQKLYKETYEQKVKQLETNDVDLLRLQGIIMYLNEKLRIEKAKK